MTNPTRQQGLTLIELLVTMVLLGFIMTLMSGAFVQISQMLRISSEHGNGFSGRWVQSRALNDIVANMVADPALPIPLAGAPARVSLTSLALPPTANGVAQRATLDLRTDNNGATVLRLEPWAEAGARSEDKAFELARFDGRLSFFYLDAQGLEHAQWPPSGATQTDKLPSAIGIRDSARQGTVMQVAHYEGTPSARPNNGLGVMFGATR
jgi:general secretion pathway protein J